MKYLIAVFAAVCIAGASFAEETNITALTEKAAPPEPQPQVEVAFVLDTTGSMGGLIAGAKEKIWYIANQVVLGEPSPNVKMALVPYRDKGDEYVTKVFDLTDNIDQVYIDLMSFTAGGGGDGPENVNQALNDAISSLSWSDDKNTLKIIYLVGDYPPHNEYTDVPKYDELAKAAIEKDIMVNTILCGANQETAKVWQDIAALADGSYLAIAQDGGVKQIATPYDKELAELNAKLLKTAVVYGDKKTKAAQAALNRRAEKYDAPAAADRAAFSASAGKVASNDLVDELAKKNVELETLEKDVLPEEMKDMNEEEQKAYIAEKAAAREKINAEIKEVVAKRNEFIKEKVAEEKETPDGFDQQVVETLKKQAAKKGISYK